MEVGVECVHTLDQREYSPAKQSRASGMLSKLPCKSQGKRCAFVRNLHRGNMLALLRL